MTRINNDKYPKLPKIFKGTDLEKYYQEQIKISKKFDQEMDLISKADNYLKENLQNNKFKLFIHFFCKIFTLKLPPYHNMGIKVFSDIPIFNRKCKICGYLWREYL